MFPLEFSLKESFSTQLQMVVNSCPKEDNLIVRGNFNATTGTERDGYQSCVGPRDSGSRDESYSMLLDFAKSRRLMSLNLRSRRRTCTAGLGVSIPVVQGRR